MEDKIRAVRAIIRHSSLDAVKLTKKSYDMIEDFANDLGAPKYGKSMFRGIGLHRGNAADAVKVALGILADKRFRLSSFTGGNRHAESWSKSPETARDFAKNKPFGAVLESRPAAKDIVADLQNKRIRDFVLRDDFLHTMKGNTTRMKQSLDYSRLEREVVVRTGNRKYSLCRNIIYFIVKADIMREGRDKLPDALMRRLGNDANKKDFQRDHDDIDRWSKYRFACKGGTLVYLPGYSEESNWFAKLASR